MFVCPLCLPAPCATLASLCLSGCMPSFVVGSNGCDTGNSSDLCTQDDVEVVGELWARGHVEVTGNLRIEGMVSNSAGSVQVSDADGIDLGPTGGTNTKLFRFAALPLALKILLVCMQYIL